MRRERSRGELVDDVWDHFDHGTQRAILRLYRSAPEDVLRARGRAPRRADLPGARRLGRRATRTCRTEFAQRYADALGGQAEVELAEAGHWPWLDRPELVDRVADFVG